MVYSHYMKVYPKRRRGPSKYNNYRKGRATANKNKNNLIQLNRKVNQINRVVKGRTHNAIFTKGHDSNLAANYDHFEILCPTATPHETAMTAVFNTDSSILSRSKLLVKGITTKYTVSAADEQDPVMVTVTLLAPKTQKVLQETYSTSTGVLNLTSGVDYVMTGGIPLVNKLRWKIHHYRRTQTMGQDGDDLIPNPVGNMSNTVKLRNLNWEIVNHTGNWDDVPTAQLPPYMRLFYVVFNDNSVGDLTFPTFTQNTLIMGSVSK